MSNEKFIWSLLNKYQNLMSLNCNGEILKWENEEINMENINLQTFYNLNSELQKDIPYLSGKDFFDIIKCHVFSSNKRRKSLEIPVNLEEDAYIKNLRVIDKKDKNGFVKTYIYYIDNHNNSYLIENYSPLDVVKIYNEMVNNNYGNVKVSDFLKYINSNSEPKDFDLQEYITYLHNNKEIAKEQIPKIYPLLEQLLLLYKYQKYLIPSVKEELENYRNIIRNLQNKIDKSELELEFLKKYAIILDKGVTRKLTENKGSLNPFMLIGTIVLLGIILAFLIVR